MIYDELKQRCLPLIEAFHDDLLKHDKAIIEAHEPGTPFLHYTRACGTHLFMLIPAASYPRKGEFVRYLFGHADREHILSDLGKVIDSFVRDRDRGCEAQKAVHYFDGKRLKLIDVRKAQEICFAYRCGIRREWDAAERRCDPIGVAARSELAATINSCC